MEEFHDTFPADATEWETVRDLVDLDVRIHNDNKYDPKHMHSVHLLPRQDVSLYGIIPKMDQTSYTKCNECRLVFNSRDILAHKACARRSHYSSTPNRSRKSKSKRNSNKKTPTLPPPPLFKKPPSPTVSILPVEKPPPKISLMALLAKASVTSSTSSNTTSTSPIKIETKVTPLKESPELNLVYPAKLPSSTSACSANRETNNSSSPHSSSTNNRLKKSKKSTHSKSSKDSDVNDVNLGVAELCSRQETFPVTITIPTKSVLKVSEKPSVKPEIESEDADVETASSKPSLPTVFPLSPKIPTIPTNTENIFIKSEIEVDIPENNVNTMPVVYMPVSPISVITYPQDLNSNKDFYVCIVNNDVKNENMSNNCKKEDSAIEMPITTNTPRLYSIPNHNLDVKRYKSHPKPIAVPTYSTKKIGGAILLSNQRIERQRNDILMAINKNRSHQSPPGYNMGISLLNHSNSSIRSNILKVKSMNKVNCKRISSERMMSTENKQIKMTSNINGFIIHSDMIDTTETPLPNNCIQEKIAYFL